MSSDNRIPNNSKKYALKLLAFCVLPLLVIVVLLSCSLVTYLYDINKQERNNKFEAIAALSSKDMSWLEFTDSKESYADNLNPIIKSYKVLLGITIHTADGSVYMLPENFEKNSQNFNIYTVTIPLEGKFRKLAYHFNDSDEFGPVVALNIIITILTLIGLFIFIWHYLTRHFILPINYILDWVYRLSENNLAKLPKINIASTSKFLAGYLERIETLSKTFRDQHNEIRQLRKDYAWQVEIAERAKASINVSLKTIMETIELGHAEQNTVIEMLDSLRERGFTDPPSSLFKPDEVIISVISELGLDECETTKIEKFFCINGPEYKGAWIYAIAPYYGQMVKVLISNAHRYGGGHISIDYLYNLENEHNGQLVTRIRNNGTGLTPEQLEKMHSLFDGHDKYTQTKQLGLFVASRLCLKMKGNMNVNSDCREWTEFTFQIPVEITKNLDYIPGQESKNESEGQVKYQVLLIGKQDVQLINGFSVRERDVLASHMEVSEVVKMSDFQNFDMLLVYQIGRDDIFQLNIHFEKLKKNHGVNSLPNIVSYSINPDYWRDIKFSHSDDNHGVQVASEIVDAVIASLKMREQIAGLSNVSKNVLITSSTESKPIYLHNETNNINSNTYGNFDRGEEN